jgi:hypothetical protein
MLEKSLIDDSTLPITTYNYSAVRDRLIKRDIKVPHAVIENLLVYWGIIGR